jgi:hypothetical protein
MCTLQRIDSTRDDTCLLPAIMSQPVDGGNWKDYSSKMSGCSIQGGEKILVHPKGNTMDDLHHSQNKMTFIFKDSPPFLHMKLDWLFYCGQGWCQTEMETPRAHPFFPAKQEHCPQFWIHDIPSAPFLPSEGETPLPIPLHPTNPPISRVNINHIQ